MMDPQVDHERDPQQVWNVFSSTFQLIMNTKVEVKAIFEKYQQLFQCFPQVITPTEQYPSSNVIIHNRREALIQALLRRVFHLTLKENEFSDLEEYVQVLQTLLNTIHDYDPVYWKKILDQILNLWRRLTKINKDLEEGSHEAPETCEIFEEESSTEDEEFKKDLNTVTIDNDFTVVETIQKLCTFVFDQQISRIQNLDTLDKIVDLCLKQLETGEASLKKRTLVLLAHCHGHHEISYLEKWTEESHFMSQVFQLICSENLSVLESDLISCGWVEYVDTIITKLNSKQCKVFSTCFLPALTSDLNTSNLTKNVVESTRNLLSVLLKHEEYLTLNDVKILKDKETRFFMRMLGCLALHDLDKYLQNKSKKDNKKIYFYEVSESWNLFLDEYASHEHVDDEEFYEVLNMLIHEIVEKSPGTELVVMKKPVLEQLTQDVVQNLCCDPDKFQESVDRLETLIKIGFIWPGASKTGSEILALQSSWVGLLSLPWFSSQDQGKLWDLKLTLFKDLIINTSKNVSWSSEQKSRALVLLSHLPRDLCPKWRMSVMKIAWSQRCEGLVNTLPAFTTNTSSSISQIVSHIIERKQDVSLVRSLSQISSIVVCCMAKRAVTRLVVTDLSRYSTGFRTQCQDCGPRQDDGHGSAPVKSSSSVESSEVDPFLKLIGHEDPGIRLSLLSMLPSISSHSSMSPAAVDLWMSYLRDEDENVRCLFSRNIVHMISAKNDTLSSGLSDVVVARLVESFPPAPEHVDTYILTLVSALSCQLSERSAGAVLDTLLDMFLNQSTTVAASIHALPVLQKSVTSFKKLLLSWGSKKMCDETYTAKNILLHLLLIFTGGSNFSGFLENNLKHFLPTIVVHATSSHCSSVEAADRALDLISKSLNQKTRMILLIDFPEIFTHMIVHAEDQSHLKRCTEFVEKRTYKYLSDLLPTNRQKLLVELLTLFNFSRQRIIQGLLMCAKVDKFFSHPEKKNKSVPVTVVPKYVSNGMMGVLTSFSLSCNQESTPIKTKLQILLSLNDLVAYLKNDHLVACKYTMLDMMKVATNLAAKLVNEDIRDAAFRLWDTFIKTMDLAEIQEMLPQILCCLLYFLAWMPRKTADVIKSLLENSLKTFGESMPPLMFLPDIPEIDSTLRKVRSKDVELKEVMTVLLVSLQHESVDVRLQTIRTLSNILDSHSNIAALQGLIVRSDRTPPEVTNLVNSLMAATSIKETDVKVRLLAADCLGKIGAVDPGKLELSMNLSAGDVEDVAERNKVLDVFSVGFCVELLQVLLRAKAGDPQISGYCAYSLQEIFKVYKINLKEKDPHSFTWRVWRKLSEANTEKLTPLLSSMYVHEAGRRVDLTRPVYSSDHGKTYRDWLAHWSQLLVDSITDPDTRALFKACLPAIKKNLRIAEFLLPKIVVQIVCKEQGGVVEEIVKELNCIIEAVPSDKRSAGDGEANLHVSASNSLFSILDYAGKWIRVKHASLMAGSRKDESVMKPEDIQSLLHKSEEYVKMNQFLHEIQNDGLANLSFNVNAVHRAAFHLEQYIRNQSDVSSNISALQKLYVGLKEPDLVLGVAALLKEEPEMTELIQLHQATGNHQDALSCYEISGQDPLGQIRCYLDLSQPQVAASVAANLVKQADAQLQQDLVPLQVEAAWQLEQWQDVSTLSKQVLTGEKVSWEVGLGNILWSVKTEDWSRMRSLIETQKQHVVDEISTTSMEQGAYNNNYSLITRLGMLSEVQLFAEKILMPRARDSPHLTSLTNDLLSELSCRLTYTRNSWEVMEPVLRLRRCCLGIVKDRLRPLNPSLAERIEFEIGNCWLRSAKLARSCGKLQECYTVLTQAKQFKQPETFLESAKLNWERGNLSSAVNILKRGLKEHFSDLVDALVGDKKEGRRNPKVLSISEQMSQKDRDIFIESKMKLAQFLDESSSVSSDALQDIYQEVKLFIRAGEGEELFFNFASFLDKQFRRCTPEQQIHNPDLIYYTCIYYLRSIHHGPRHVMVCLPRMLSVWLEFAEIIQKTHKDQRSNPRSPGSTVPIHIINYANGILTKFIDNYTSWGKWIPKYFFLTALPQLVSNICHPHVKSFQLLSDILTSLLSGPYSQQTFWQLVSVSKNRDPTRRERCSKIFDDAMKSNTELHTVLTDSILFAKKIDELCELKTEKHQRQLSLNECMKSLPALVNSSKFSQIILPNQRNLLATLPTSDADVTRHQPFPCGVVNISGLEDQVKVMPSLVQPKKITFRGSDGKLHSFLAKAKDDLRRDSRLMDYNCLLNKLFMKDAGSRNRNLQIRVYSVIPTSETNGLIEWVNNLMGIRPILYQLHKEEGRHLNQRWAQQYQPEDKDTLEVKRKKLADIIKVQDGAIFSKWFIKNFPDPQSWFMARMAFVRSTAVMSMIGYIIGLGDRHLENINVDTNTGETFHVDMNLLFNKGELLNVPEVVPFRLTHNIVDAFGPVGVEGPFRIACEIALGVMRKEKDVLMSTLRPFACDPLIDWVKESRDKGEKEARGVDIGLGHLKRVEDRLTGVVTSRLEKNKGKEKEVDKKKQALTSHPLSVQGQVDYVVSEAMDPDNLAVMYWGWAPYL